MKYITALVLSWFFIISATAQLQKGKASFYADKFEGRLTASGEKYYHSKYTAAHKKLPFGTIVQVINQSNQKSVYVVINDRGPYVAGRIIDVSKSAAEELDFVSKGLADVVIEVVDTNELHISEIPERLDPVTIEETEFYAVESRRIKPDGLGIQIGAYQEMVNVMRLMENLQVSYQKEVIVQVNEFQNIKIYNVIIGQFESRIKAEQFLEKVTRRYPDSFIIDFDKK